MDDCTEFENSTAENDNVNSKDLVIVKKEDKVDVKPIVTSKKKRKRQLDMMHEGSNQGSH